MNFRYCCPLSSTSTMASPYLVLRTVMVFLIPAYFTLAALTTNTQEDDQSWLRYWVVISIISLLELVLDNLSFLPCYTMMKVLLLLWCLLPGPASGSNIIFSMVCSYAS